MPAISTPAGQIHYQSTGSGGETYLIFHGFGQSLHDMLPFDRYCGEKQKFIFIDFFHHGKSRWKNSKQKFTSDIWRQYIIQLQAEESFKEFHLIGYSMGGKISLLTFEIFSNQVKSLTLLAPDGIKTGMWYNMSSYPAFVHDVFKQVVSNLIDFSAW